MTNLTLVENNKKILYTAIGTPSQARNTHIRMLKSTTLYHDILRGNVISNIQHDLESFGEIP